MDSKAGRLALRHSLHATLVLPDHLQGHDGCAAFCSTGRHPPSAAAPAGPPSYTLEGLLRLNEGHTPIKVTSVIARDHPEFMADMAQAAAGALGRVVWVGPTPLRPTPTGFSLC